MSTDQYIYMPLARARDKDSVDRSRGITGATKYFGRRFLPANSVRTGRLQLLPAATARLRFALKEVRGHERGCY